GTDHNNNIAMSCLQCNLIDPDHFEILNWIPIDGGTDLTIKDALSCINANGLFPAHIFKRAVDQFQTHLLLESCCD
ncbi:hypothetical protein CKO25_20440, partial [Thiocapsa imhoffii]